VHRESPSEPEVPPFPPVGLPAVGSVAAFDPHAANIAISTAHNAALMLEKVNTLIVI